MQPIAAHTYMAVSDRGGISSKFLPLQPTAAHSYMVILVRGRIIPQNPTIAEQWSANLYGRLSQGRGCNSSEVLLMQPIAVHSYMAFSGRGGNSSKVIPLQLTLAWQL